MRHEKIRKELIGRIDDLLADHIEDIEASALATSSADDSTTDPKAKASLAVNWEIGTDCPKLRVSISYSTRIRQDMEAEIDLNQTQIQWGEVIQQEGGVA